jgi:hypothetical protein
MAMMRLYADIESGFGRSIVNILKKQFPGQEIDVQPASIGHKLMAIARKQLQNNDADAQDAIGDLLSYLATGSKYETDGEGKVQRDEEGKPIERKESKPWDFTKDTKTWQEALDKIYSNLRTTAMSRSFKKTDRMKKERTIDEAYGSRGDGGGAPEGGEGKMPTPEDTSLGKALDDKAAVKEFIDLMDEHVPTLRGKLSPEQKALFDLIFEDEIGSFGSDIKENMGQASALKEKLEKGSPEEKAVYDKNAKRWSGFVGDTRKKLLDSIWDYIEKEMTPQEFRILKETFFADTDASSVRKREKEKAQSKVDYQRGIDLRKVLRMRAKEKDGSLPEKDKKSLDNLVKKLEGELKKEGKSLDAELEKAGKSSGSEEDGASQVAARVAGSLGLPPWVPS